MIELTEEVIQFLHHQSFVIISTIDDQGTPHSACKGIVKIDPQGRIYLLDLYQAHTQQNLQKNTRLSLTAVDEHKFRGYCLKGQAEALKQSEINPKFIEDWEARITSRITQRVLKNITDKKGSPLHPEAILPQPQYLIVMEVEEIVDLTPQHLRRD